MGRLRLFVELVRYIFTLAVIKENKIAFSSRSLCQDPLEKFFGCQRQRGGEVKTQMLWNLAVTLMWSTRFAAVLSVETAEVL